MAPEEVTKDYEKTEKKQYAWGSEELDTTTQTSESSYFKLENGEKVKIKVDTSVEPEEDFVTFKEEEGAKRRFNIKVLLKDSQGGWSEEKTWSIAPMFLRQINSYITQTTIFEVEKTERSYNIVPLGLPAE